MVLPNNHKINHLIQKFPLGVIHRMLGHVNVKSLQASIKNKTFDHFTMDDIDWSGISNF